MLAMPLLVRAEVQVLCFEHIGPQDKSMPSFCVQAAATLKVGEETIRADAGGWLALQRLLVERSLPGATGAVQPGWYQVCAVPAGSVRYLRPQVTRTVVTRLLAMPALSPAQAQLLARLLARLPPSTRGDSV
ncbi:MAG: hypothetical protein ACEQSK_20870 [Sphingomonadaceae bacterium]